ncbi:MAG: DUF2156 domain-containing protein [Clostridia bacterium]|nr:DUF2156 domain-containing protein [Clostridia bacterium]
MLLFKTPEISDAAACKAAFTAADRGSCEYCFGNVFAWTLSFRSQIALHDGFVFYKGGQRSVTYLMPVGGRNTVGALELLFKDVRANAKPFHLAALSEAECKTYFADESLFCIRRTPDTDDFVYRAEDLAELKGGKYHAKRNHITRFLTDHPDWHYEKLTTEHLSLCKEISDAWFLEKHGSFDHEEYAVVQRSLDQFEALGFEGGILFTDGKAVAFTMGEKLTADTFCTHLEKCAPEYRGAYPVINREFAKQLQSRFSYINREDCAGDEGLRKAKQSYKPALMVEKFSVYPTAALYDKLGIYM